jgi:branched-chain amino acid transport system substrate-binding protein
MSRIRRATHVTAALLATLLLASCASAVPVEPSQPLVPAPPASGDGVLRIGTLLPTSGPTAFLSPAQVAGVELAVRDINEAGGVLGAPVEVFHRNSGQAETETAEASFAELVAKGVDVIVGPSSSVLAERILPLAVTSGVLLISPSASSPALTGLDDGGLLARTVPSTALQGRALAHAITEAGEVDIAVIAFDDDATAAGVDALAAAVKETKSNVVATQLFGPAGFDVAAMLSSVSKARPDAVVLMSPFSAVDQNAAVLTALSSAGLAGPTLWVTSGVMADYSSALAAGTMAGVRGLLEGASPDETFASRVRSMNPAVTDVRFAAEAYDATILAALAATVAEDDGAPLLAFTLADVSGGGIKCLSLGECLDVLHTHADIDYDGVSGPIALDAKLDPGLAHYGIYAYDSSNRFSLTDEVLAR